MTDWGQIVEFIQKQKTAFIASVDEEGFPNIKAMFVPVPIHRVGIKALEEFASPLEEAFERRQKEAFPEASRTRQKAIA